MSDAKPVRPPQVTVAGWMVVGGSVVVVASAFSSVAGVHSLETREAIERYLSQPPGDALGIGVTGVQAILRVAGMVAAACAAATAILGWSALQRSKGARVALSALAVPLFLAGLVSGGFAAAVVCAAIVMMWFQPARDWFDGRTPPPRPRAPAVSRDPLLDLPPPSRPPLHPTQPPTLPPMPYAAVPAASSQATPSRAAPTATAPRVRMGQRPAAVRTACVLTWTFASMALVVLVLTLGVMLADSSAVVDEARRQNPDLASQGITDQVLRTTVIVTAAVVIVWSAAAIVFASLAWRRVRWAAVALLASAALAALVCLVVTIGSLLMLVPLLACASTVALLIRPEARRWFSGLDS